MFVEQERCPWGCTDSKRHHSCLQGLQFKQSDLKYFTRSKCLNVAHHLPLSASLRLKLTRTPWAVDTPISATLILLSALVRGKVECA